MLKVYGIYIFLIRNLSDAAGSDPKSYTNKLLDVALKAGI